MKTYLTLIIVSLINLTFTLNIKAQGVTNIVLSFPDIELTNHLKLVFDNGKDETVYTPKFEHGKCKINLKYYSIYAHLSLYDTQRNTAVSFYFSEKPAFINFKYSTQGSASLKNYTFENAYEPQQFGKSKFHQYTLKEEQDFLSFVQNNMLKIPTSDSLQKKLTQKNENKENKALEFIKNNGNLYYSFWYFRKYIISNAYINPNTLLNIFQEAFSNKFKNSTEGGMIKKVLVDRISNIHKKATTFEVIDITGKEISLEKLSKKYVLLTFWSSSCKPCLEEIPIIKQIRNQYNSDQLEIISFFQGQDFIPFCKYVAKFEMNWTHIFNNNDIYIKYNIKAIPQVYLISPKSEILYDYSIVHDDIKLTALNNLLASKIIVR